MALDKARIVDEALNLLDEVGLDAFSTRTLAQRLGVKQPALYWHFKNRRSLLDAMNDRILAEAHHHRLPSPSDDWRSFLRTNAHSFRAALLSRRDGARVHAGTEANLEDLIPSERQLQFLATAGWSAPAALDLLVAISRYTIGCVLEEQGDEERPEKKELDDAAARFPLLSEALSHYRDQGHATAFENGLNLLLLGAAVRLDHINR